MNIHAAIAKVRMPVTSLLIERGLSIQSHAGHVDAVFFAIAGATHSVLYWKWRVCGC